MKKAISTHIRRTTICAATALAIALPSIASAGAFDRAKSRVQGVKARAATVVSIVREKRPVANALQNAAGNLAVADLFEMVRELRLKEQLQNTMELLRQINADYKRFSGGGSGCEAECGTFREDLKALFAELLSLVDEVPVLSKRASLAANLERLPNLIDRVPPRALYLMWQAQGDQMEDLRMVAETIRQTLDALPPFVEMPNIGAYASMAGTSVANSPICEWTNRDKKPVIEWVQAEMEWLAWKFKTVEGFIPDIAVKADAGASAGAAVANGTASAGASVKPTDIAKIALKVAATVPEAINMAIKLNMARAKMVCAAARFAAN